MDTRTPCILTKPDFELHLNFPYCMYGKFILWKMRPFALQSMGRTNHKFPVYATHNVQIIGGGSKFKVGGGCNIKT